MVTTSPGSSSISRMRECMLKLRGRGWEPNGEFRALRRFAGDPYRAAMLLDNRLDQIQPETRAVYLLLNCPSPTKERIEDAALLIAGDARAVIRYPDLGGCALLVDDGFRINADPVRAFRPVFKSVIHKIM